MKTSVWTYVVLLMLVMPSCMMTEEDEAAAPLLVAWCDDSSDCAGDLICDDAAHVCVIDEPLDLQAWVRLLPPDNSLLAVEEQYGDMEVSNSKPLNLALNRPIKVVGKVVVGDKDIASLQVADITAVSDGEIPDLKIHEYAKASDSNFDVTGAPRAGFTLWVNQGKPYDITVNLTNYEGENDLPPYHIRKSFKPDFTKADPFTVQYTIEVPVKNEYLGITGRLLKGGEEPVPLVGAKVHAICDETGNASSVVITDSEGQFSILIQPLDELDTEVYKLHIKPSALNELVPRLVVDEVEITESAEPGDPIDTGTHTVDGLQDLMGLNLQVLNPDEQFELTYLAETVVRFTAKVSTGAIEVERTVDSEGKVYAVVPRMNYVVSVMPPTRTIQGNEQKYGIHQELLQLEGLASEDLSINIVLAERPEVHGFVLDPLGHTVANARVEATFTGKGTYPDLSTLPTRLYESTTDDTGRYKMRLDPGQYRMVVDPPVELGFPRRVERNVYVQSSQQRTFDLAYPSAVIGTVVGMHKAGSGQEEEPDESLDPLPVSQQGEPFTGPAANVKIELYDETEANSLADGLKPEPIATAITDAEGNFILVVPAE